MAQLVRALEHVLGAEALGHLDSLVARALARSGLAVAGAAPAQRAGAERSEGRRDGLDRRQELGAAPRRSLSR